MRLLIRGAVQRIDDIANDLASKKKKEEEKNIETHDQRTIVLLSSIIEPVISEKRIEYRNKPDVFIESNLDASSYGLFAHVVSRELKRMISNLIAHIGGYTTENNGTDETRTRDLLRDRQAF